MTDYDDLLARLDDGERGWDDTDRLIDLRGDAATTIRSLVAENAALMAQRDALEIEAKRLAHLLAGGDYTDPEYVALSAPATGGRE